MKITIDTEVAAPIEAVWSAWTTPADIETWNAASDDWHCPSAELDLRPDGRFCYRMEARDGSLGFDFEGTFTHVAPHQRIDYRMDDDRVVTVDFVASGDRVTVRETFDADPEGDIEQQRAGWQAILTSFARHTERTHT